MRPIILLFVLTVIAAACGDPAASQDTGQRPSPEATLRRYQAFVDSNQFEAAGQLSTPAERERLQMLSAILAQEDPDSSILHTRFLSVTCETTSDSAFCRCLLEDEYERYEQAFQLIWRNGAWRVDAPRQETIIEDQVIEDMLESLDTLLQSPPATDD